MFGVRAGQFRLDALQRGFERVPGGKAAFERADQALGLGVDAVLRDQTIRVETVNALLLNTRKDAVQRFVRAFRETLDWMYADPAAIDAMSVAWSPPSR